ncbi:MAG: magnesium and cobalt transport protein CorA [Rhodocyclaceae bacterium]|nr:MAG: magnesium and cobalt transport protein CorA [Rhodocyclaceae bacterium]
MTSPNPGALDTSLEETQQLRIVQELLARQRRVENLVHRQDMPRHDLVENLVHKQHLSELKARLDRMPPDCVARILEALPQDDSVLEWEMVAPDRGNEILDELSEALRETFSAAQPSPRKPIMLNAFELQNGRLRQIPVDSREDLTATKPIWVDLVAPSREERKWIEDIFGLRLPDADDLTDLEESARFYIEENGEVHLHSNFLLDKDDESRNVAVAFILHNNILFSMRDEELPVFRLQRLRARIQPGMVSEGKDVLLDLYAADVEYSADALEDIYSDLEVVGSRVLNPQVTDAEAALILSEIARGEDLNGRIRRNVLDTRRALSFLMRGRQLSPNQHDDTRQILRDIESLDGHTSFLFGKINFLMDATVGFININQNQRVSKLTTISVVFMPINILAGIGGMSEFSMMTKDIPWPVAYGAFVLGMAAVGWLTFVTLRFLENRKLRKNLGPSR